MHACTERFCVVQGPFTYEALPPSDISFVPLKQSRAFNAAELMEVGITLSHVITLPCTLYLEYTCLLCGQAAVLLPCAVVSHNKSCFALAALHEQ